MSTIQSRSSSIRRLCILGGSSLSTPVLINALLQQHSAAAFEVVVTGRDAERLALVEAASRALISQGPAGWRVWTETDPTRALADADVVVNQIRPGGLEGRAFDETFPHDLGLPGEETLGPGGFSNACRAVPAVLNLARIAERVAPHCLWLNLTNPCSLVQTALQAHTRLNVIGLCELPLVVLQRALRQVTGDGHAPTPVTVTWTLSGVNHVSWLTSIQVDGHDRLPQVLEQAEAMPRLGVDADLVRQWGALPMPYLRYYVHPDRALADQRGKPPRARAVEALLADELARWRASRLAQTDDGASDAQRRLLAHQLVASLAQARGAVWHDLIVAPVVLALVEGRSGVWPLNLPNRGRIPGLPDAAIVETDVPIIAGRPAPGPARPLPPGVIDLVARHQAFEQLAAEAIVTHDRAKALDALLLNPMIRTRAQAEGTLAQAWAQTGR